MSAVQTVIVDIPHRHMGSLHRNAHRLSTAVELREVYLRRRGRRARDLWVAWCSSAFETLVPVVGKRKGNLRLLLLEPDTSPTTRELLRSLFQDVLVAEAQTHLLPEGDLWEVLGDPRRKDLVIACVVAEEHEAVVLFRGNLERMTVPARWFTGGPGGGLVDFRDVQITDSGQTLRLGQFEASMDAILYEHDAEYRRRAKRRLLQQDDSLGGSLRRLRLQKGLTQGDFSTVPPRTIRRIEKGETVPRRGTLERIAERLGVGVEEIGGY